MLSDQAFTRKGNKSYLMISSYLLVTFTDRSAQEKTDSPSSPDLQPFSLHMGQQSCFPPVDTVRNSMKRDPSIPPEIHMGSALL